MTNDRRPANEQIVMFGLEKYKVQERKFNSCQQCQAGDHCRKVDTQFSTHDEMGFISGCRNRIFLRIEKK